MHITARLEMFLVYFFFFTLAAALPIPKDFSMGSEGWSAKHANMKALVEPEEFDALTEYGDTAPSNVALHPGQLSLGSAIERHSSMVWPQFTEQVVKRAPGVSVFDQIIGDMLL